jgi:hypothetical protein
MTVDEDQIRIVVTRLARPDASGGFVIERAALLAEGRDFPALAAWIVAHGGTPQAPQASTAAPGVHRLEHSAIGGQVARQASRYLLPASAFD